MASTIRDVAMSAGVSTTTVSRVLNDAENVSKETRTKVLTAISRLQYCPNQHAAELRRAYGCTPNGKAHLRAPVGKKTKRPAYPQADLQEAQRQKGQLHFLEGEFARLRHEFVKLNNDLEKLRTIIG